MDRALAALLARLSEPDSLMRLDAARRLGELGHLEAVPALIDALGDREWRVREAAAQSLGQLADGGAVVPLCQQFDDPRAEVRQAAIGAVDALGDGRATASLIFALERERDGETRRVIVRALGNLGDGRGLRPLQRLTGDAHWAVRREAAEAAKRIERRLSQQNSSDLRDFLGSG